MTDYKAQDGAGSPLLVAALEKQKEKLEAKMKASIESSLGYGGNSSSTHDDASAAGIEALEDVIAALGPEVAQMTEGMSDGLRSKMVDAIADLEALGKLQDHAGAEVASAHAARPEPPTRKHGHPVANQRERQLEAQVSSLKQKLDISRSIMRKLHFSNVELEKELKLLSATSKSASSPLASVPQDGAPTASRDSRMAPGIPSASSEDGLGATMMQERDLTIDQLKAALDASRCRAAALEQALLGVSPARLGANGGGKKSHQLHDVLAQSAVHFKQYKQIRGNYNKLLARRTEALGRASGASSEAKLVVNELQSRLTKEMEEREVESAMYNARLYENEKQQGDWYVERRILERRIKELELEIKERDKIDADVERCIVDIFNQIAMLEQDNKKLQDQLRQGQAA
eukprot:jgi/Tetstr1/456610/TSEL_043313.t1